MSNLIEHAKRELTLIGEEKNHSKSLLEMVEIFAKMGHSGASAAITIHQLNALLSFENISPLTDNPDEWVFHGNVTYGLPEDAFNNGQKGVWQNRRNGEAFSNDGGKTYYLLHETEDTSNPTIIHESAKA